MKCGRMGSIRAFGPMFSQNRWNGSGSAWTRWLDGPWGSAGPGIDIIEHPESELHPAAHAAVAELLLKSIRGTDRPLVIETHSEMILLRTRRWIAEGRLDPSAVIVYWIEQGDDGYASVRPIGISRHGDLDDWPEGVFYEDYEEVLAIRRAARRGAGA